MGSGGGADEDLGRRVGRGKTQYYTCREPATGRVDENEERVANGVRVGRSGEGSAWRTARKSYTRAVDGRAERNRARVGAGES